MKTYSRSNLTQRPFADASFATREIRHRNGARLPQPQRREYRNGFMAMVALVFMSVSLRAGIPEPDLVWYGKVLTTENGAVIRVTSGTLVWQIEPLGGGTPWNLSTRLTNINDQFSFVLRVRCETPEPGVTTTPETVGLTLPATGYRRLTVKLDGEPLSLNGAPDQFFPALADRGRSERIDLMLGAVPADADGDGLADAWEQQYFGGLAANPNDDPDGDGMTNLREYRAGTNPIDPQSLFEVVEIRAVVGGVQIGWSSQPDRRYRVLRSNTLLAAPSVYQILQTGITATPPMNEFLDTATAGGAQFFYLIKLEE